MKVVGFLCVKCMVILENVRVKNILCKRYVDKKTWRWYVGVTREFQELF